MDADYSIQLLIPYDTGQLRLNAERFEYLLMDLEQFAANLDTHCDKVSHEALPVMDTMRRLDFRNQYWSDKGKPFLGYGKQFTARFGEGYIVGDPEAGEVPRTQFEIDFKVNVMSLPTVWPNQPVFVGADGSIDITKARQFSSSLRNILAEPF